MRVNQAVAGVFELRRTGKLSLLWFPGSSWSDFYHDSSSRYVLVPKLAGWRQGQWKGGLWGEEALPIEAFTLLGSTRRIDWTGRGYETNLSTPDLVPVTERIVPTDVY